MRYSLDFTNGRFTGQGADDRVTFSVIDGVIRGGQIAWRGLINCEALSAEFIGEVDAETREITVRYQIVKKKVKCIRLKPELHQ